MAMVVCDVAPFFFSDLVRGVAAMVQTECSLPWTRFLGRAVGKMESVLAGAGVVVVPKWWLRCCDVVVSLQKRFTALGFRCSGRHGGSKMMRGAEMMVTHCGGFRLPWLREGDDEGCQRRWMQVVDGGRSVVAAVTGASSSWWLPAMVGHGG
ncbi:hypothetical protein DEO72_LG11g1304 [Vigna unguiculata]|uniref:Uncharacterized protein n=1 Tax=Vigna unguiculata TaxID=3917 RepID=A0A4D6NPY9_VIGUN|nr:hypothetical protein DEO72_LG11g1304 [Vigna unguiculata]